MLTNEEYQEITNRLTAWCTDEKIDPADAAVIFIKLCGSIVAQLADDAEHLENGISALETILKSTARQRAKPRVWVH